MKISLDNHIVKFVTCRWAVWSCMGAIGLLLLPISIWTMKTSRNVAVPGKLEAKQTERFWNSRWDADFVAGEVPKAHAYFEVKNTGETNLNIQSVESGCGCTSAIASPTHLAPGQIGRILVEGTPFPVGERAVNLLVKTDSLETPSVPLQFRMMGSRRPPFLLQAKGDLVYLGGEYLHDLRTVEVIMIEPAGSKATEAKIRSKIPFLDLGQPSLSERAYFDPSVVQRVYLYKVKYAPSAALSGSFSGEIEVFDPWDEKNIERIQVRCESLPEVSASPSRLVIRRTKSVPWDKGAKLSVTTKNRDETVVVELSQGDETNLIAKKIGNSEQGTRTIFSIHPKSETSPDGEYRLMVRSQSSQAQIIVPVVVRTERF